MSVLAGGILLGGLDSTPTPTPTPALPMLIGSMPVPSGAYQGYGSPDFANNFLSPWTIAPGVTGFSLIDVPVSTFYGVGAVVTDAVLVAPALQITDAQTGWRFELSNGATLVGEIFLPFGSQITPTLTANDNVDVGLVVWVVPTRLIPSLTTQAFAFTPGGDFTLAASDDYSIKLYLQE